MLLFLSDSDLLIWRKAAQRRSSKMAKEYQAKAERMNGKPPLDLGDPPY